MKRIMMIILCLCAAMPARAAEKESAHSRVMRTGTIRCGYIVYPPALMKNPQTGALSGMFYDFMNEIGAKLSLKVEWTQEAGWATYLNDLKTGRYDMMCSMAWRNAARAREGLSTAALYYSPVYAWVRKDDSRFDKDARTANDPAYRISTIDGGTVDILARADFPRAQRLSLPEMTTFSDVPLNVAAGKADMTFIEPYIAQDFLKSNPDTLKRVGDPLRVYPNVMWVAKGEQDFLSMVDAAVEELLNTPLLDTLFKKYDIQDGSYFPPAKPYEASR